MSIASFHKGLHEKSLTRLLAENSTMAAMSNTCSLMATHAIEGTTAKNVQAASAFKNSLVALINGPMRAAGLNLDENYGRKNGLIDLLACIPKILEEYATWEAITKGFVLGGMIDPKELQNPVWNNMMSCNRRWASAQKERGLSKEVKDNCRRQFQAMMKIQLQNGQVTAEDMLAAGLPRGE
jgi:hypothetical protein